MTKVIEYKLDGGYYAVFTGNNIKLIITRKDEKEAT